MSGSLSSPSSPIASSKRAKLSPYREKDLKSPGGERNSLPLSSLTSSASSKVIFSPALRADDTVDSKKQITSSSSAADAAAAATSEKAKAAEDDDIEEFDPYLFIRGLPKHSTVAIRGKKCLPRPKNPSLMTLTLDLDETLVHCSIESIPNPDMVFPVSFQGVYYEVYVRKRPHLDFFLQAVSKMFEVVVFTASQKVYADKLLDILDPAKKMVQHRLFREACLCVQGNYIKDLDVLCRDLSKTVLVDNSPHAYGYNIDNGVPIISWFDDDADTELLKLLEWLKMVKEVEDVRTLVRDHFKTRGLVNNAGKAPYRNFVPPF